MYNFFVIANYVKQRRLGIHLFDLKNAAWVLIIITYNPSDSCACVRIHVRCAWPAAHAQHALYEFSRNRTRSVNGDLVLAIFRRIYLHERNVSYLLQ